jgi:hypothetical protein
MRKYKHRIHKVHKQNEVLPPQCPIGFHNWLLGDIEHCHTHKYHWRQIIHEAHCKTLKCPYAKKAEYGKWNGLFDNRETRIIG